MLCTATAAPIDVCAALDGTTLCVTSATITGNHNAAEAVHRFDYLPSVLTVRICGHARAFVVRVWKALTKLQLDGCPRWHCKTFKLHHHLLAHHSRPFRSTLPRLSYIFCYVGKEGGFTPRDRLLAGPWRSSRRHGVLWVNMGGTWQDHLWPATLASFCLQLERPEVVCLATAKRRLQIGMLSQLHPLPDLCHSGRRPDR